MDTYGVVAHITYVERVHVGLPETVYCADQAVAELGKLEFAPPFCDELNPPPIACLPAGHVVD
jgi:hypothetical protein